MWIENPIISVDKAALNNELSEFNASDGWWYIGGDFNHVAGCVHRGYFFFSLQTLLIALWDQSSADDQILFQSNAWVDTARMVNDLLN